MKLIIDISEDYYKSLQKHGAGSCAENTILNGTLLSECKLEDCITVNIQGLDEGIRCAMCTNTMANDRGCDGACRVDDVMYSKVLKVIQDCTVPSVYPKSDKPSGKWIPIEQMIKDSIKEAKNTVLEDIKAEIKEWYWQADKQAIAKDPCVVDAMVDLFIRTINKHMESEDGDDKDY